jgi:hypothetical protein
VTIPVLVQLGAELDEDWRARDYDEQCFPALAGDAIDRVAPQLAALDLEQLLRWVATERMPEQHDPFSVFGDLAVTAFRTTRMMVSVLFWSNGSTAIHQHRFSGAFAVLSGSSIHVGYQFDEARRVNGELRLGTLDLTDAEFLVRGDRRPIHSGQRCIHSLFHLDSPSVTLVVRTIHDPGTDPQWDYCRAGVATAAHTADAETEMRVRALPIILSQDHAAADTLVDTMLETTDLGQTFRVLEVLDSHLRPDDAGGEFAEAGAERFDRFLSLARHRHGEALDQLLASIADRRRTRTLMGLRNAFIDADDRFTLALLINIVDRDPVLQLLAERYPDRTPIDELTRRVARLAAAVDDQGRRPPGLPTFSARHHPVFGDVLRGTWPATKPDLDVAQDLANSLLLGPLVASAAGSALGR